MRTRPAPPRRKPDHMHVNSGGKLTFVSAEHEMNSDERLRGCKSTPAHVPCAAKSDQTRVTTRRELNVVSAKHQVQASVWSAHLRLSPARAPRVPTLRSWIASVTPTRTHEREHHRNRTLQSCGCAHRLYARTALPQREADHPRDSTVYSRAWSPGRPRLASVVLRARACTRALCIAATQNAELHA